MADQKGFSQKELQGMVTTLLDQTRARIRAYEDQLLDMRRAELAKATPQPRPQRAIGVGGGVEELGAGVLTGKKEILKLEAFANSVGKGETDLGHENLYLSEDEIRRFTPPSVSDAQMRKLETDFGKDRGRQIAWNWHKKYGRSEESQSSVSKSLSKAEVPLKLPPPVATVGDAEAQAWQGLVQRRGPLTKAALDRHENHEFLTKTITGMATPGVPPTGTQRASPTGADKSRLVGSAGGTGLNLAEPLSKPPVSEAQRRAMHAAASGNSTLGIPKKVGKEFSDADQGGKLPETKKAEGHPFEKAGKFSSLCSKCAKREYDDVHKTEVTTAAGFPESVGDTQASPTGTGGDVQPPTKAQANPGDGGGKSRPNPLSGLIARAKQGRRCPPVKKGELGAATEMQQGVPGSQTRTILNQAEPCPKCGETHTNPQGQPVDHATAILFGPNPRPLGRPTPQVAALPGMTPLGIKPFGAIRAKVKSKKTESVGMGEPYQAAEPPMAKPPSGPSDRTKAPTSVSKPLTAGPMTDGKAAGGGTAGVPPGGALKMPKLPGLKMSEDEGEGETCPTCGGQAGLLGSLGNREHFQCRGCGMQYSREGQPQPVADRSIRGIRNRVRGKGLDKGLLTSVGRGSDPARPTRAPLTPDRPSQPLPTPGESEKRAHAFQSALGGEFQPRPGQPVVSGLETVRPRPASKFAPIRARVKGR